MVRKPENRMSGICQIKLYCAVVAVVDHRSFVYQLQLHYILLAGPRRRRLDVIPRALDEVVQYQMTFKRKFMNKRYISQNTNNANRNCHR